MLRYIIIFLTTKKVELLNINTILSEKSVKFIKYYT